MYVWYLVSLLFWSSKIKTYCILSTFLNVYFNFVFVTRIFEVPSHNEELEKEARVGKWSDGKTSKEH